MKAHAAGARSQLAAADANAFVHASSAVRVKPVPGAATCDSQMLVMRVSHAAPNNVAERCPHAFAFVQYADAYAAQSGAAFVAGGGGFGASVSPSALFDGSPAAGGGGGSDGAVVVDVSLGDGTSTGAEPEHATTNSEPNATTDFMARDVASAHSRAHSAARPR